MMTPHRIVWTLLFGAVVGAAVLLGPSLHRVDTVDTGAPGLLSSTDCRVPEAFAGGDFEDDDGGGSGGSGGSCSCTSWSYTHPCGDNGCSTYKRRRKRSCTPSGCATESYCSSNSCCTCSSYQATGVCGGGGCPSDKMQYTRTCTPNGCRTQETCGVHAQCSNPNQISGNWEKYGFAMPGDEDYSFTYDDNAEKDFMAFAAKGNIVIGDYTSSLFESVALPKIGDESESITQPYAVDPTDTALGYHTGDGGVMYDSQGRPLFDGNYDQVDGGTKLDGDDRKFYESTLSDADFQALIDTSDNLYDDDDDATLDGVFFTNHALVGAVNADEFTINGTIISRDDALMFREDLYLNHDTRLMGGNSGLQGLSLPMDINRFRLITWDDCPHTGCT